ncbi:MAG: hypothetical protein ACI31O_07615 [Limosilactobacillus vaginalis]|uniref:hypothetical protein n=1 Tax=Limosilactobacillus vaginalis TaxID=1633 RepID=UPI003F01A0DF
MTDRELYFRLFQLDADGNGIHVKTDRTGRKRTLTISTLYPDPEVLPEVLKECNEWVMEGI